VGRRRLRVNAGDQLEQHAHDVPADLREVRVEGLLTALIPPTVTAFGEGGLPAGSRIAGENPFGEDLRELHESSMPCSPRSWVGTSNQSSSGWTTLWE
jgi:hypothetical protein